MNVLHYKRTLTFSGKYVGICIIVLQIICVVVDVLTVLSLAHACCPPNHASASSHPSWAMINAPA